MAFIRRLPVLIITLLSACLASAESGHDFGGTWLVQENSTVLTLSTQPGGTLRGTLAAGTERAEFSVNVNGDLATGTYVYNDIPIGMTLQLQPDGNTMFIWDYELDEEGTPIESTYTAYAAVRQEAASEHGAVAVPGASLSPFMPFVPATAAEALELIGSWYAAEYLESGQNFWTVLTFTAAGSFTADYYDAFASKLAWSSGHYETEGHLLTLTTTEHSEEVCLGSACQPFTGAASDSALLFPVGTDMFVTVTEDRATGQTHQMMYMRAGPEMLSLIRDGLSSGNGEAEPERWCGPLLPVAPACRCGFRAIIAPSVQPH